MIGGLSALTGAVKEGMTKIVEKGAALKNNVEKLGMTEFKEKAELQKMVAQEADTETAMNSSLESVIEANKEKLEAQENKVRESNESKEGLTAEEKKAWIAALTGVTCGSDAFFPFGDNVERARKSGVQYIVEPGGSIRDDHVIETANKYGMVMAFTGMRLFHH